MVQPLSLGLIRIFSFACVAVSVSLPKDVLITTGPGGGLHSPDEGDCMPPAHVHAAYHSFHQPWELEGSRQQLLGLGLGHGHVFSTTTTMTTAPPPFFQPMYCPDIVPIKIRGGRGKSLESLEDAGERERAAGAACHTFSAEHTHTFYYAAHMAPGPCGWRPRSYDDGDITPTNEVRPGPFHRTSVKPAFHGFGNVILFCLLTSLCSPLQVFLNESVSRSYLMGNAEKKERKEKKKRNIICSRSHFVTVDLHSTASSPLSLPAYPSSDELASGTEDELPLPPPPAPGSPPTARLSALSRSWTAMPAGAEAHAAEQDLLSSLALQQSRNGSDASFKSSSSTESDSLPFANENAGTIKQRATRPHPTLTTMDYPKTEYTPPKRLPSDLAASQKALRERSESKEPADVLNDIGNMLANLTDELDAMLEEEKRQGLSQ
ncbi:Protein of unknown function [Gryllus bimaculatus]|nr:Protein of unknown function [Gryllus bimaculatus]